MEYLKKISLYFLCFFLIFPSEIEHVVTFVPNFLNHYEHHIKEHHSVSFYEFILEHTSGNEHEKEHHQQEKCPVDHSHAITTISLAITEPPFNNYLHFTITNSEETKAVKEHTSFCSSAYLSSIWQPPQVC